MLRKGDIVSEPIVGHCAICNFQIYDSEMVYKSPLGMIHPICKDKFVEQLLGKPTLAGDGSK